MYKVAYVNMLNSVNTRLFVWTLFRHPGILKVPTFFRTPSKIYNFSFFRGRELKCKVQDGNSFKIKDSEISLFVFRASVWEISPVLNLDTKYHSYDKTHILIDEELSRRIMADGPSDACPA